MNVPSIKSLQSRPQGSPYLGQGVCSANLLANDGEDSHGQRSVVLEPVPETAEEDGHILTGDTAGEVADSRQDTEQWMVFRALKLRGESVSPQGIKVNVRQEGIKVNFRHNFFHLTRCEAANEMIRHRILCNSVAQCAHAFSSRNENTWTSLN
jgi:hypothetical protein